MRGRIGKVGVFVLALVFAIGAMGAAFASWTDTVSIEGDITTGSLGYEICEFSETWVYKVIGSYLDYELGDLVVSGVPLDDEVADGSLLYVASADWEGQAPGELDQCLEGANQSYNVTFDNLFPCTWFKADIVLHYIGTVPAKLSPEMVFSDDHDSEWLENLWDMTSDPEFYMVAYKWEETAGATGDWVEVDLEGLQLEYCDRVMIEWWLHIPQNNELMNRTAGFTTTINMVQWNEYSLID